MPVALPWRPLLVAATLGLVLRVAFGLFYWVDKPLTHDEREYLALAQSLQAGHGFRYPPGHDAGTGQQFGRAPGYPAFLALLPIPGEPHAAPTIVKVVQSGLGALTVLLVGLLAWRAAGRLAAILAAAAAAVYPPLLWLPAYVFSETLYMPIAFGSILALDAAGDRAASHRSVRAGGALALAAGVLAGLAVLVRPGMLLYLPLAAAWLLVRRRWPLALALCVGAAVVVSPWTLRNAREYGRIVLVASEGGVTFWTGNHPLARGEGDLAANPELKRAELEFRAAHPGLTAEALEPLYYRETMRTIAEDPVRWIGLLARKLFYTFVPIGPSYTLHSTRYLMASVLSYGLVAPLGFVGVARLLRRRRSAPLLLLAASVVLTSLIFFPQERFRAPVIDPTLLIGAAVTASGALRRR